MVSWGGVERGVPHCDGRLADKQLLVANCHLTDTHTGRATVVCCSLK